MRNVLLVMRRALSLLIVGVCLASGVKVLRANPEVYFSQEGGIRNQIIRHVNLSRSTIDIAMYSFTDGAIAQALAEAHERGVMIRIIRDYSQSRNKHDENTFLRSHGIAVKVMSGKGRGIFHHKFAIFDNKVLETGSFNWTTSGERYNHENAIFFTQPDLIEAFKKEFDKLWKSRGR
jgi:phosphatidylserine/phosphatidylglycerophosphate/cardiolipin synthase-like enzyme